MEAIALVAIAAAVAAGLIWLRFRSKPEGRSELCEVCGKRALITTLHRIVDAGNDSDLVAELGSLEGGTAMEAGYCPEHCPKCEKPRADNKGTVHAA